MKDQARKLVAAWAAIPAGQPLDARAWMAVPTQLTTNVKNETFGGVTYHIEGELVPALQVELSNTGVYFEHHILLWKDPAVQIGLHPMKGAFKRMLAGMPFLLTGATGPGPHRLQPRRRGPCVRPAPGTRHERGRARAPMAGGDGQRGIHLHAGARRGEHAAGRHGIFH